MFDVSTHHPPSVDVAPRSFASAADQPPWNLNGHQRTSSANDLDRVGDDDDRLDTEIVIWSSRTNGSGVGLNGAEPHRRPYSVASFPINAGRSETYAHPLFSNARDGADLEEKRL